MTTGITAGMPDGGLPSARSGRQWTDVYTRMYTAVHHQGRPPNGGIE